MADEKLSQYYRDLESLEPARELDQAILAAARSATQTPRAPLVMPRGRRRWYYSFAAAAAVLVFAVALTLHVERERPDSEPAPARAQLKLERELKGATKPAAKEQAAAAPPAQARDELHLRRESALASQYASAPAAASARGPAARETPQQWLERIAELRRQGRHAEADKELAQFRRAYPDYALTDAMRERVERR